MKTFSERKSGNFCRLTFIICQKHEHQDRLEDIFWSSEDVKNGDSCWYRLIFRYMSAIFWTESFRTSGIHK